MSEKQQWIGMFAVGVLALVLAHAVWREDERQVEAAARQQAAAIALATESYALNCVVCHGAAGEGIGAVPPLASDGVRGVEAGALFDVIERGRYNTTMAAWSVDEGGVLTEHEIANLVTLIQYGDWETVRLYVEAAGLTPPQVIVAEVSDELIAQVRALPQGETLAAGLKVFADDCAACHNANGEGTSLAPALNTAEYRAQTSDEEMRRLVLEGVPGTLMAGWRGALPPEELDAVLVLLRQWETLNQAQIVLPTLEAQPAAPPSPELIASGEKLFRVLCTQCHGASGQGTPLAPTLNSQTFLNDTPDAAIGQIIAMGVEGTIMPAWGGRLTETDIAAITAYMRSWQPTAPPVASP